MSIYRGSGGAGTTADTAALDEVTTYAQEAAQSATAAASSASAASTSETNAASSASSASTSATNAATSETNSANSATAAANSATAAANSATASSNSATSSETSYQNTLAIYGDTQDVANAVAAAQAAQTGAETAETNAETSASNASASATASANSATASASSASSAATSETNAANSATAASTSASAASTSASNAESSATASANSATASAASATAAAASAANAASAYDSFDDRYLGSKASNPSVDNDGNALVTGALYYNSTSGEMRVYDGSLWIAASSASIETMEKFKFTATSGQTVFSGSDDSSRTLSLIAGVEIVTLNGIVLEADTDYTATNSAVTLATGATDGDELNVYAFGNFQVADTVSKSLGGTFDANVNVLGNVGIGTSSPLTNFHTSTTGATTAYIETTGGTNSWARVTLATPAQKWAWTHANGYNNNRLELYNETSNNVPVAIDTAGRVTMPYQPSFSVSYDGGAVADATNIPWNLSSGGGRHNTGNHFNTSTGVFTAPVGGKYLFNIQVHHASGSGTPGSHHYFDVTVNGGGATRFIGRWTFDDWYELDHSVILSLAANDQVAILVNIAQGQWMGQSRADHNRFSGHLLS